MPHIVLLSLLPPLSIPVLALGGIAAFLLTYFLTFGVIALARKAGWVEQPVAGKIHTTTRPRIGGLAIYAAFVIALLVLYASFLFFFNDTATTEKIFGHTYP